LYCPELPVRISPSSRSATRCGHGARVDIASTDAGEGNPHGHDNGIGCEKTSTTTVTEVAVGAPAPAVCSASCGQGARVETCTADAGEGDPRRHGDCIRRAFADIGAVPELPLTIVAPAVCFTTRGGHGTRVAVASVDAGEGNPRWHGHCSRQEFVDRSIVPELPYIVAAPGGVRPS